MTKPKCLMIGGGKSELKPSGDFDYIHLDINPDVQPDIVADAGLLPVADESYEAVYASHVLEHLNPRRYGNVLEEWYRVLKPGGEMWVRVPNLLLVAEKILQGRAEEIVYISPVGPITALDMLVGWDGKDIPTPMSHRWGFTVATLALRAGVLAWQDGLVWEHREATPYDRCEIRLYGRKPGEHLWTGWEVDKDLTKSGDPYAIRLGG